MKSIVVYYSQEGNTQLVAEKIQQIFHADILRLRLIKEPRTEGLMRLFSMGRQVYLKEKPALSEPFHDFTAYDKIFLGSPIWMGTMTPAIRSFVTQAELSGKLVIPFCTYKEDSFRFFEDLRKSCPQVRFSFGMGFKTPKAVQEEALEESIRVWLNNMRS